ncbi:MAG: DUF2220 family protein [Spirochaetia bacterium]|jgi:hypothetical protein|nr:DUF2220 family protein [Spirochaetia bacterium]
MIDSQGIIRKAKNKFDSYLAAIINENVDEVVPWTIRCSKQPGSAADEAEAAYVELGTHCKDKLGQGYTLELKKVKGQTRIKEIRVDTPEDLSFLCGCSKETAIFKETIAAFKEMFPDERTVAWLLENRKMLFKWTADQRNRFLDLACYLHDHPDSGLYPRELPVKVPTKFLEQHAGILVSFLQIFGPLRTGTSDLSKLGLLDRDFTLLARAYAPFTLVLNDAPILRTTVASLTLDELETCTYQFNAIFILENETTFRSFPIPKNCLALYFGGFAIGRIPKDFSFFSNAKVFYFGDLDEHGFAILSLCRSRCPNTQSFCMDRLTLSKFNRYRSKGETCKEPVDGLTDEERQTLALLKAEPKRNRLEQEKISKEWVLARLEKEKVFTTAI